LLYQYDDYRKPCLKILHFTEATCFIFGALRSCSENQRILEGSVAAPFGR
jgi:hypothetical protein